MLQETYAYKSLKSTTSTSEMLIIVRMYSNMFLKMFRFCILICIQNVKVFYYVTSMCLIVLILLSILLEDIILMGRQF
jgi:hypothetical protein